jgi:hypothetical protein
MDTRDVHQTLHIQHVLPDVSFEMQLSLSRITLWLNMSELSKHVGPVLSPGNFGWVQNCNLSEKCVNIGLTVSQVDIHKLMFVCELGREIPFKKSLYLGLSLARHGLQMLEHADQRRQAL